MNRIGFAKAMTSVHTDKFVVFKPGEVVPIIVPVSSTLQVDCPIGTSITYQGTTAILVDENGRVEPYEGGSDLSCLYRVAQHMHWMFIPDMFTTALRLWVWGTCPIGYRYPLRANWPLDSSPVVAIKLIRDITGMGLKESKALVDGMPFQITGEVETLVDAKRQFDGAGFYCDLMEVP